MKRLLKFAREGKDFALFQLAKTLYPISAKNPNDPRVSAFQKQVKDRSLMKQIIQHGYLNIEKMPAWARDDKELMVEYVQSPMGDNSTILKNVSMRLKGDRDIVTMALKRNGNQLKYASSDLCADAAIVETAPANTSSALEWADFRFLSDRRQLLEWSRKFKISLANVSPELRSDEAFVKELIKNNPESYRFADETLRKKLDIARLTFISSEKGFMLLRFAPPEIQDNEELVRLSIKQDERNIEFASARVKARLGKTGIGSEKPLAK